MKKRYSKYIRNIEKNRKKNNLNWMNILRIAMEQAPNKTKKLLDNINKIDKKISKDVGSIIKSK